MELYHETTFCHSVTTVIGIVQCNGYFAMENMHKYLANPAAFSYKSHRSIRQLGRLDGRHC